MTTGGVVFLGTLLGIGCKVGKLGELTPESSESLDFGEGPSQI